ncbi:MAG: ion transporter [Oscillospiraceae bacterium]|nr:ion transporter [Oscillospiraceae bacterium]
MRGQLYEMVDSGGDDILSVIYDSSMMVVIIASLVPMCFKSQSSVLFWIDKVAAAIFIIDYVFRWITADHKFPKLKGRAFAIYPFTPMAIVDLLAILPSIAIVGQAFRLLKILRLLRTFRVVKFLRYSKSIRVIIDVLKKEKEPLLAVCYMAIGYIFITALIMFSAEPDTFDNFFDVL